MCEIESRSSNGVEDYFVARYCFAKDGFFRSSYPRPLGVDQIKERSPLGIYVPPSTLEFEDEQAQKRARLIVNNSPLLIKYILDCD